MPSEANHKLQAEHNEQFARGLSMLCPKFVDWAATACFYAAVHLVDSYLARHNIHPSSHGKREHEIRHQMPHIVGNYLRLKQHSIDARYECAHMNPINAFQPNFIENILRNELEAIKRYINGLP